MTNKLIFLDIDGTLTEPGSNVPPESALAAVRSAQSKGNKVFLCTGRNPAMLAPLLKYGFDGVVGSAGGYVTYGDEVIYDRPMTDEQLHLAIDKLHGSGVFCTIEAKDATYGDDDLSSFMDDNASGGSGNSEIARWRAALAGDLGIQSMTNYDGRPIYKVVFMCQTDDQLDAARDVLEQDFNFCVQTVSEPACLNGELINRDFDKGRGIKRICEYLNVPVEDTFGFGDSMNDLEMIETVGTSVVMANGNEKLKAMADYVCPAVTEDGLAQAFARFELS